MLNKDVDTYYDPDRYGNKELCAQRDGYSSIVDRDRGLEGELLEIYRRILLLYRHSAADSLSHLLTVAGIAVLAFSENYWHLLMCLFTALERQGSG